MEGTGEQMKVDIGGREGHLTHFRQLLMLPTATVTKGGKYVLAL